MLSSFTALQILPFMHQPLLHHYLCIDSLSSHRKLQSCHCRWPGLKSILEQSTLEPYQTQLIEVFSPTIVFLVGHCSQQNIMAEFHQIS